MPPGVQEFYLPPPFDAIPWLTKPILLVMLSVVIIVVFLHLASRKRAVVPSRMQFAGELVYGFVRDGIARDTIGSKDYKRFVPLLFAMFVFIMVNNLYGILPVVYFPPMAKIGFPLVLAVVSLIVFNVVGIRKQGFFPYFKNMMFIPGVPAYIYPLLAPIELLTALIIRPFTLTLRLFANMFAGHMLLLVFIVGAEYMLIEATSPLLNVAGVFTGALAIGLTFYEIFVELFQAYIFTLLTALYIAGATGDGH